MLKTTVLLLNSELPYNRVGIIQGYSGVTYGNSVYDDKLGMHVARMSIEEYRECRNDLAKGYHRSLCRWMFDVEIEEVEEVVAPEPPNDPAKVGDAEKQAEPIKAPAAPVTEPAPELAPKPAEEQPAAKTLGHTAESLSALKFAQLVKIAREAGVPDYTVLDKSDALREAILKHQA